MLSLWNPRGSGKVFSLKPKTRLFMDCVTALGCGLGDGALMKVSPLASDESCNSLSEPITYLSYATWSRFRLSLLTLTNLNLLVRLSGGSFSYPHALLALSTLWLRTSILSSSLWSFFLGSLMIVWRITGSCGLGFSDASSLFRYSSSISWCGGYESLEPSEMLSSEHFSNLSLV